MLCGPITMSTQRRAADDLLALGLRDAARDRDQHPAAFFLRRRFQLLDAAEFGKDLFRRPLADVAGVQHHEVRVVRPVGLAIVARE